MLFRGTCTLFIFFFFGKKGSDFITISKPCMHQKITGLASLFSVYRLTEGFTLASVFVLAGLTRLVSLNMSNSRITSAGLKHLKPLKNLKSLTLESCKVTANDIKKLQSTDLPQLVSFRPE